MAVSFSAGFMGVVILASLLQATSAASFSVPLEHRLVRNWSRNLDLFPMSRHALHYDLLLGQNRDRSLYMMKLLFTSQKFPLKVVADTGSSILWVNGLSCMNNIGKQTCGTFVSFFKYGYLDGPIEGDMVTTSVFLNDEARSDNTYVLLVNQVRDSMDDPLVGLGPKTSEFPTFMEKLLENKVIQENEFTIDLRTPKITFGQFELATHDPVALPVINPLGYYIALNEVALFGRPIFTTVHDCIVDSGNTLIAIPFTFQAAVLGAFRDAGWSCRTVVETNPSFFNILCDFRDVQSMNGKMVFKFGKQEFAIEGEDLFIECASDAKGKVCKTAIELHNFNNGVILGQPFFRVFPITFDLAKDELRIWKPRSALAEALSI